MNSLTFRTGLLLAVVLAQTTLAAAQAPTAGGAPEATMRTVAGRVVRPSTHDVRPVPALMVTLHRVGPDGAGPVDSVRTGSAGRYAFRYRPTGSEEAIYFVSASYGGIAYFSPPLRAAAVTGEAAELTVFDTTTAPIPLQVRGRHFVVSAIRAPAAGEPGPMRTVIEVFEISNDSSVTAVAGTGAAEHPTFIALLPADAQSASVGQGDVPAGAVTFRDGRALVFAPFAPGLKQLSIAYSLPASAFPLSVPMSTSAVVLEVLLEEAAGQATGGGLVLVDPVSVEGRTFRRFLAENVAASAVLRVTLPVGEGPRRTRWMAVMLSVFLATMAAVLVWTLMRRRRVPARRVASPQDAEIDRIAAEIATLDEAHEAHEALDERDATAAHEYAARRASLKARLADLLAARTRRP